MPNTTTFRIRFVLLLASLLSASCEGDHSVASKTLVLVENTTEPTESLDEPCAVVLSPYVVSTSTTEAGVDPVDMRILRLQSAAQDPKRTLPYLEKLGWAFVQKARTSFDPGFYVLAEQTARCLEAKQPQSVAARLLKGHVLHNLHEFKAAEALARQLVEERGLWFEYGLLGDVLMEQGNLKEAKDAYQRMMDQRPGPQAYSRASQLRYIKGDLAGAIEMMEMAVRSTSLRTREAAAWARAQAALLRFYGGDISGASSWITSALDVQPSYPPALLTLGRVLLAQDELDEAVSSLRSAANANPSPQYLWPLLEALRSAGRMEEAGAVEAELKERGAQEDPRTFALYLATYGSDIDTALRLTKRELAVREDVFTFDARLATRTRRRSFSRFWAS